MLPHHLAYIVKEIEFHSQWARWCCDGEAEFSSLYRTMTMKYPVLGILGTFYAITLWLSVELWLDVIIIVHHCGVSGLNHVVSGHQSS